MKQVYSTKGMLRKCTTHKGDFEMIGKRITGQASGSLYCAADNSVNHTYHRKDMGKSLIPQLRSIINSLQNEALQSGYSCGDIYMYLTMKVLRLQDTMRPFYYHTACFLQYNPFLILTFYLNLPLQLYTMILSSIRMNT